MKFLKYEKMTTKKLKNYTEIFVYICFAASILGYFSKYNFLFDICSQFRMQYLLFGLILLVYCIIRKHKNILSLLIVCIVILNLISVLGNLKFNDVTKKQGFKIEIINLLTKNKKYNAVRKEINDKSPDILVIQELDDKWSEELQAVKENYPFIYEISRQDNFGIALYSKIHITEIRKFFVGTLDVPAISAFCDYEGKVFEIICIHTTPPTNQTYFKNTQKIIDDLANYVVENGHNVIITGDFNTAPYSYNYKNFVKTSKMKDLSNIFHPTWPTFWLFPFRITLDHLFVTKSFAVRDYAVGNNIGSDHLPIWAEISFKE